jgi:rhodanese-related sulfurtransferase
MSVTAIRPIAVALALLCIPFIAEPAFASDCASPNCLSPRQFISAMDARRMKLELGTGAIVVDIDARLEAFFSGMPIAADVHVPFMEPAPGLVWNAGAGEPRMEFRWNFSLELDEVLRSVRLRHDQPVILACHSVERARLAALLLQEYGYSNVFIVRDGLQDRLVRSR